MGRGLRVLLLWLIVACSGNDTPDADGGPGGPSSRGVHGERPEGRGEIPAFGWMVGADTVEPHAVAVDRSGNVFVGGELVLSVDLGGGVLKGTDGDAFLVSYTSKGEHRWSQRFGGAGWDRIIGLDVDAAGDVYATGELQPGADLGDGPAQSAGVFIASWDSDGGLLWSLPLDVVRAHDLAVTPSGIVYVTGEAAGTIDLGGGALTASGPIDAFVASYDSTPAHRWSVLLGGSGLDYGFDVAAGTEGAYVTGQFYDVVDFGGGEVASFGSTDVFAVAFDPGGSHRWSMSIGGSNTDGPGGIAVDTRDIVTTAGTFDQSVVPNGNPDATISAFLMSNGPDGSDHGGWRAEGAVGHAVAIGASDAVYAAGLFSGAVDFGGGEITSPEHTSGCWAASHDADGQHRWSVLLPWAGPPAGPTIATGPGGVVYLAGQLSVPHRNAGGSLDYRASFLVQLLEGNSLD